MNQRRNNNQSGLVSIFIVIFSALLVTIVTVSFVSLMIRNQQQASNADLSNSAYDAAMAGVEDAKRLLLIYRECKANPASNPTNCPKITSIIETSNACNMVKIGLNTTIPTTDYSEVLIRRDQADPGDDALDQAYTCVKIKYLSDGIPGTLKGEEAQMIPMEASEPYSSVRISWQKKKEGGAPLSLINPYPALPNQSNWSPAGKVTPALLRAQWIQTGSTFKAADFDHETDDRKSNTNTLFLYPTTGSVATPDSFSDDLRPKDGPLSKTPFPVGCDANKYDQGAYACSVALELPAPITDPSDTKRANTYLRLNALYGTSTDYKVELLNSAGKTVEVFSPTVDSTGRANDLFRRVKATISFTTSEQLQPSFDINGDLCKNFRVTDKDTDYEDKCNP